MSEIAILAQNTTKTKLSTEKKNYECRQFEKDSKATQG